MTPQASYSIVCGPCPILYKVPEIYYRLMVLMVYQHLEIYLCDHGGTWRGLLRKKTEYLCRCSRTLQKDILKLLSQNEKWMFLLIMLLFYLKAKGMTLRTFVLGIQSKQTHTGPFFPVRHYSYDLLLLVMAIK